MNLHLPGRNHGHKMMSTSPFQYITLEKIPNPYDDSYSKEASLELMIS